jgi:hypothetical protein
MKKIEVELLTTILMAALHDAREWEVSLTEAGNSYALAWRTKRETYEHVLKLVECCTVEESLG